MPVRVGSRRLLLGASAVVLAGAVPVAVLAVVGPSTPRATRSGTSQVAASPAKPAKVCGDHHLLDGPSSPPPGAVTVQAGPDRPEQLDAPHTTYWFAPGRHTLGAGKYQQIDPGDGDTYVGAPGAVLSGRGVNLIAFGGHALDVTIEHLTVEDFGKGSDNATQGVVNHTSAIGWTVRDDTIQHNSGAGVMMGSTDLLHGNCLRANTQYGFSAYRTGGVTNVTVVGNEVSGNATFDWEVAYPGCGCEGGAKFWDTHGAVVTRNYVHGNHGPGLWVDADNAGFEIARNYISHNDAEGIIYEISYNARIADNTLVSNGLRDGAQPTAGFLPAIYVSESGADARVPGPYSGRFDITGNLLRDNWGGVVLWENANRFCGEEHDLCTLVDPSIYTPATCKAALPTATSAGNPDYFDNCRWKTQGVRVSDNTFLLTPGAIGPSCTAEHDCGLTGLFSEYGTVAPFKAWVVPNDISNKQHDVFTANTYRGPWRFDGFALGDHLTWSQWTHGLSNVGGSGDPFHPQDAGSTYHP